MLSKRIVSTIVLILVVTAVILVDWICGLVVTAFIIIGLYEFFSMLENKGINIYKYVGMGIGAIIPLSMIIPSRFEPTKNWELLFIVLALLSLILMQLKRRKNSGFLVDISTTIFGVFYVSWLFSFMIKIRYLPGGLGLLVTVILITKACDIGALLIGTRFGRTPFFVRISPKKSVEGSIGGVIFSILAAFACRPFLHFSYPHLMILGMALGILAQLGDLSESLMKRDCQVKDSGRLFPGIGGMLDLIDSLFFTAPVFYFYLSTIK